MNHPAREPISSILRQDTTTVQDLIAVLQRQDPKALVGWPENGLIVPVTGIRVVQNPGKRTWILLRGRHVQTLRSVL